MSVDLTPDVWDEIQRHVASGVFRTPNEVVREALSALRAREQEYIAIQDGIDDMESGRVRPIREFDREFRLRNGLLADE